VARSPGRAAAAEAAIVAANPELRPVTLPRAGLLSAPVLSPDLYPDDKPDHGYFVPFPPPAPFKSPLLRFPLVQVGTSGGRQWTVQLWFSDSDFTPARFCLSIRTYVRMLGTDLVPFTEFPWVLVATEPGPIRHPGPIHGDQFNLVTAVGRRGITLAGRLRGEPPVPRHFPPVAAPLILDAWTPAAVALLEGSRFLEAYARWERSAGSPEPSGPVLPVVRVTADRFDFELGFDADLDPRRLGAIVREVLVLVPELERSLTGRDAEVQPIPTVTLRGPSGSVDDVRPAYRCPRCGEPDILRTARDPSDGLAHRRTLRCGADVFPAAPS
jgi:hypothetical protein